MLGLNRLSAAVRSLAENVLGLAHTVALADAGLKRRLALEHRPEVAQLPAPEARNGRGKRQAVATPKE